MPDQDKLEHNDCDIYKHICVQYLKVIFASSEIILTVVMDERTYLIYEKRLQ